MGKVLARIQYPSKKKSKQYIVQLKGLLSDKIEYDSIETAYFENGMVLGTVEFDKDHLIYVLMEEEVLEKLGILE